MAGPDSTLCLGIEQAFCTCCSNACQVISLEWRFRLQCRLQDVASQRPACMISPMKATSYPLAVAEDLRVEVWETAAATGLSLA
jgi:hypothetical protein